MLPAQLPPRRPHYDIFLVVDYNSEQVQRNTTLPNKNDTIILYILSAVKYGIYERRRSNAGPSAAGKIGRHHNFRLKPYYGVAAVCIGPGNGTEMRPVSQ
jgi:hypothetical protein